MVTFRFRDDGLYYVHVKARRGTHPSGECQFFLCFVYSNGCIAAQCEQVVSAIELDTDFMHTCFLWHHDVKKSNVSNPALARLMPDEAGMIAADVREPEQLNLRLIPLNDSVLSIAVVGPWKSDRITRVHFQDYDSFLKH
jgi:hypothetical protein